MAITAPIAAMGCPICLDAYGEDNERGTRPVALPCGHVFHKMCSDGWLKACRLKGDAACCPLCKKELGTCHALTLWPSDLNDLDFYMQHRSRRMELQRTQTDHGKPAPATQALDRYMSREAQSALLGKLIDFRQHVNGYVMAVNNVSMSTFNGDRIFRLFMDTTKNATAQQEIKAGIDALSAATVLLSETIDALEALRTESEEKTRKANENVELSEAMRRSYQNHMETKAAEEQRMDAEASRVKRLQLHLKKELQDVERRKEAMEKERKAYINEAREKATDAMKARLESAQIVAQSRGDAEVKVGELNKYVQEQERLRVLAEDKARESKKKSNWLADRNKLLSSKLDAARNEIRQLKAQVVAQMNVAPASSSAINTVANAKGKAKEHAYPERPGDDGAAEYEAKPAVDVHSDDDDLEATVPSGRSSLSNDLEGDSHRLDELRRAIAQSDDKGRRDDNGQRDAVVIEDDDLDAELDDHDYPMPVLSRTASSSLGNSSVSTVSSSSAGWPGASGGLLLPSSAPASSRRTRNAEDDMDDSIEFVSHKRPRMVTRSQQQSGSQEGTSAAAAAEHETTSQLQVGMAGMMPSNSSLIDRIMQGRNIFTGPRRRAR